MWLGGEAADVPVRSRASIGADAEAGPLLVDEYDTTVVVPDGWSVRRHLETGTLVLEREATMPEPQTRVTPSSDPVTLQIVANALQSIADEMATTIIRTAHSTVVRDGMDFSSALCDARGETVAQAVSVPFHLGSIPTAMDSLLGHYGDRIRPGDVFIMNDPFDGGMHLQDIFIVKPVHLEETLIGWAVTTAHHGDVGGRLPGSSACDNTEIFQEGLRMPWLRFYAEGEPVEEVHKLIEANMRIPRMTFGDLGAQVAACSVAERALQALARRHGREELASLMIDLIDYTERLVRQEIATWPDGTATFTDYLGSDGVEARDVPITARVTIAGDEVIADLTESAPMVRGSLNSTRSFVMACVYQAVRCALTLEVPNTAGAFRPITVLTKPGTVAEVVMPGASSMRGVTGFRVLDALNGALAQLIPDRIPAAGEGGNTLAIFGADRPDGGDRFVFYELVVGTWGGTPVRDGNDGLTNPASLAANIPIEVAESEFPIVVERYGLVPDTGGAGEHRGGLAIERVWRCLTPEHLADRALRPRRPAALRARRRRHGRAVEQRPDASRRQRGDAARDVLDHDRGGRRLRPPDGGRRRLGRPARARSGRCRRRRREREGQRRGGARAVRRRDRRRRHSSTSTATAASTRREEKRVIGKADAVVIGGGIMGASTAHFLTKLGFGEVALVEKRKICGGSTQYSAAHVRQHYSNEVGIRLAVRGASMFANAEEELGGPSASTRSATCSSRRPRRSRRSATSSPCSRASASRRRPSSPTRSMSRWPQLRLDGVGLACFEPTSGFADPVLTVESLVRAAQRERPPRLRGLRGARHLDRGRARDRRRHRRRRDRDRRRRQRLRPVGRPDRPHGRRRLPDHVQPRARGDLRRARGPRGLPGHLRRAAVALLPAVRRRQDPRRRRLAEGDGAGRPRDLRRRHRRGAREQDGAEAPQPRAVARADADAGELRRRLRDGLLGRLRHHRGLVPDRRRGGARRLLLVLRRQRPRLQDRPGDRRGARRHDRGQAAGDRHLEPLRRAVLRGPHVQLRVGSREPA